MIGIIEKLLSKQDPAQPHTLLTRLLVSFCICVANVVLYGVFGVFAAIVVYLFGVELMGLPKSGMFFPVAIGLLFGCRQSFLSIRDYWTNYG